jgi:uncharacterized membrane protein YbhN (UPF0104 family)
MRRLLLLLLKVGLTAGVFVWLFARADVSLPDLLAELRAIRAARFVPWFTLAVLIKLSGIFANVLRWQVLLRGQDLHLHYGYLLGSFFVGRFFGIVTPGTLGLDGFRLYDSIRATRKPVESTTVIVIDKAIGFVSLGALVLVVFPLGFQLVPGFDPGRAAAVGAGLALATAVFFAALLFPGLTRPLLRLLPSARVRPFAARVLDAATAYSGRRRTLLWATALAVFGHLTTALMYHALLLGLGDVAAAPPLGIVLFSALLMTCATLVGPTVGGEGIRELVFVQLLSGMIPPARAFLFGHVGFWIEKALLGVPGGLVWMLRRETWRGPVTAADLARLRAGADSRQCG